MAVPRNLDGRLRRLEACVGPAGCPACRGRRGRAFLWTCQELPDGTRVHERKLPPPCTACGEGPESVACRHRMVVSRTLAGRVSRTLPAELDAPERFRH
jgi:hypothetical protein